MSVEPEELDVLREKLHESISQSVRESCPDVVGVTGWILIAETSDSDSRSLITVSGDVVGNRDVPHWTLRGWLAEILEDVYCYFGPKDEEDE